MSCPVADKYSAGLPAAGRRFITAGELGR